MSYRECAEDTKIHVDLIIGHQQQVDDFLRVVDDYEAIINEIDPGTNEYILNLLSIMSLHIRVIGRLISTVNNRDSAVFNPYRRSNN